jgi:hypothetical protein
MRACRRSSIHRNTPAASPLPDYVQQGFDAYLRFGRLEEGFLMECKVISLCKESDAIPRDNG